MTDENTQNSTEEQQEGKWYVVHVLSGQENKVKQSIEKLRENEGVDDLVYEVAVPTEKVSDTKRGQKTVVNRKFFPGYILVRMQLYDDEGQILERAWYFLRNMQGVMGIVGGERPMPLDDNEVQRIMHQASDSAEAAKPKVSYQVGDSVTVKDGPFENFEGTVQDVDAERGKLQLSVTIFGRSTPLEVEYWQVERN